jgi:diguanylate cyclase (GGDEF)-like protein
MRKVSSGKRKGWRLQAKLLAAAMLMTVLGFSAICVSVLLDMRRGQEDLARQTSENLSSTIDSDISRNIELYDLSLRNVTNQLVAPEVQSVSAELRHLILFDHAATARYFGSIEVFDAQGNLTIDAATLDPIKSNVEDREFFRVHQENPVVGLFISRPVFYRGVQSIVLSRRIDKDGGFYGVVAGTIRFSYFSDLFGRLKLDKDDVIAVFRNDGLIIARSPFAIDAIGRDASKSLLIRQMKVEQAGEMSYVAQTDNISRQFVWTDSSKPLMVSVAKPWTSIYGLWRTQALRIAGVMTLLIAFAVTVTLFLGREISRRANAEESLEELATTDALTGLRNRRKFDSALDQEWRRAERNGIPLALLMIDADHFKSYNDRFGHPAGDQALSAISGCIEIAARRAGDCAARYGGEEFVLLLPGLTTATALQIAESIRCDVAMLDGALTPLTVSIGIASMVPNAAAGAVVLVEAADKALYVAKANGRNQSRLAPSPKIALVA